MVFSWFRSYEAAMSLRDLPDWSNPLSGAGQGLFFVHADPRRVAALPVTLELARDGDNRPAFSLEVFGYTRTDGTLHRFGLLSLRFVPDFDLAERQAAAFARHPGVKLVPALPRAGFLRFDGAQGLALPDQLTAARPLQWTGTGALTFAARLDAAATSFVSDALVGGIALVDAVAQLEVPGIADRVAVSARFDPEALGTELVRQWPDGLWTRAMLIERLAGLADDGPLALEGVTDEAGHLAAVKALADRWIGRFARMEAVDMPGPGPAYRVDWEAVAPGSVHWDLREPVIVPRGMTVRSNPLATAQDAIRQGSALVRHRPLAPFETGLHLLTLYPNLPPRRAGVLVLGAQIRVPANPPARPQSVMASVRFDAEQPVTEAHLHLAPDEPLAYEIQTFAFVVENGKARRLTGDWQRHEDAHLTISPDAFPVDFVRLEAEPAVLRLGAVRAHCTGRNGDAPWSSAIRLSREFPAIAVAVPAGLQDGKLEIAMESDAADDVVVLPDQPLEDTWLDLGRFPGTGPRVLEIECRFDDDAESVLIDCVPEDRVEEGAAVVTIHLTRERPQREWRWLSRSPFAAGYRCRWTPDDGVLDAPWSEVRDPETPLVFTSGSRAQNRSPRSMREAEA